MADITNQQLLDALTEQLGVITDNMVTKDDVRTIVHEELTAPEVDRHFRQLIRQETRGFATRDDLKAFATKEDLKAFATKKDLESFATKDDLDRAVVRLERRIASSHTINVKHHLETRKAIGDLNRDYETLRAGLARAAEPS